MAAPAELLLSRFADKCIGNPGGKYLHFIKAR
jgi:hypothetical protein